MNTSIVAGDKIGFRSVAGGIVKGIVTKVDHNGNIRMITFRVTSRKNRLYKCGEVCTFSSTFIYKRG